MSEVEGYHITSSRVHTTHGRKKNQGMLALVNERLSLCYTDGDSKIIAYTPIEDMISAATLISIPKIQLDF